MRTQGNLALKATITARDIEHILSLRRTYEAQKKRLEIAENALVEFEQSIMAKIQSGAMVISPHEVQLKAIERRSEEIVLPVEPKLYSRSERSRSNRSKERDGRDPNRMVRLAKASTSYQRTVAYF